MKTIAIHQKEDWFMIQLPGYGKTVNKQMEVEVTIPDEENNQPDYKTLRDKALLERYLEKQKREITEEPIETYPSQKENPVIKNQDVKQEIMDIRKKYPELKVLDDLTSGWEVNETDNELLDTYFNQRAKDEGLI